MTQRMHAKDVRRSLTGLSWCRRLVMAMGSALLFTTTACSFGGDSSDDGGVDYALGAVQFALDDDGDISVMVGREFVTPLGAFGIAVGVESSRNETTRDLIVVIRHTVDGVQREDAYQITANRHLRVTLDGQAVQEFSPGRVLVEAKPGATIAIQSLEPGPDGTMRPIALPEMPKPFLGTWSGTTRLSSGDVELTVTLRAGTAGTPVGEWEMPEVPCKGTLTMVDVHESPVVLDTVLVERDVIEDPGGTCSGGYRYRFQTTSSGKLKVDLLSGGAAERFGMLTPVGRG